MQRTKTITIGERDITIKELSVAQIRDMMDEMEKEKITTIDLLFPDSLPPVAIAGSTGISVKKLEEDFSPSELKQVIDGVENLNPFFANMMSRMAKIGEAVLKEKASTPPAVN
ncbi:hypothetical protein [Desulfobacula toluolica]|uniref:Uncharacterized protein n=1 Tax=Desulfobacula toluolica (strain DSM 7467 / Tol2) TaxID=651182 RepID=K0NME2_DESTT|nr:hypothetical protein [Desulfobacula toluolica]CCK81198.1 uncharacterized protein TOL2_C30390 [Desulfobacula toluolica Tol2]